ncbi:MAG: hypothetical protein V7638_2076 [Acidobacteriota bacterium]|jgi:hypothetical protein
MIFRIVLLIVKIMESCKPATVPYTLAGGQ